MFNKIIILSALFIFLPGCVNTQPVVSPPIQPATQIVETPTYLQAPVKREAFQLTYGNDPSLEKAFNQYLKNGKAPNIITDGFVQFAFNNGQQPVIKTNPGQQTVISLEPGERFTNVTTGEPDKWTYSAALSGTGATQQTHILVEPLFAGISTNMVITTDKRLYNLKLTSTSDDSYVRDVRFWYPEDMVSAWNAKAQNQQQSATIAQMPDINVSSLNFNYAINSQWPAPFWKPIRVFDDGKQTYIEFPAAISTRDMPVLFTMEGSQKALVNYRSKPPYFIVDRIFQQGILVMGVGGKQTQVRLTNKHYSYS